MTNDLKRRFADFLADDAGPTAVEYALLLALLLVASITILTTMGRSTSRSFSTLNAMLPVGAGGSRGDDSLLDQVGSIVGGVAS